MPSNEWFWESHLTFSFPQDRIGWKAKELNIHSHQAKHGDTLHSPIQGIQSLEFLPSGSHYVWNMMAASWEVPKGFRQDRQWWEGSGCRIKLWLN